FLHLLKNAPLPSIHGPEHNWPPKPQPLQDQVRRGSAPPSTALTAAAGSPRGADDGGGVAVKW
ncbi:hypothetical protein Dimus_007582, partial [Dionaea muscipula]